MHVESERPVTARDGTVGYVHRLADNIQVVGEPSGTNTMNESGLDALWRPEVARMRQCDPKRLQTLAVALGVSMASLRALNVGYGELHGTWCWSFPERSPSGRWLGINRRLARADATGHTQKAAKGSRRGLLYPDGVENQPGPVFVVEGGSDAAAGVTLGLCVIGRPSNVGGIVQLAEMLRRMDRRVYIIGERDRKRHEELAAPVRAKHDPKCPACLLCWPGWAGAQQTARRVGRRLGRRLVAKLLPDQAKDLRAWLNSRRIDVENRVECVKQGRWLIAEMLR